MITRLSSIKFKFFISDLPTTFMLSAPCPNIVSAMPELNIYLSYNLIYQIICLIAKLLGMIVCIVILIINVFVILYMYVLIMPVSDHLTCFFHKRTLSTH